MIPINDTTQGPIYLQSLAQSIFTRTHPSSSLLAKKGDKYEYDWL